MRYKLLGKSGLRVSELCLGTMTFGDDWGFGAGRDESRAIYDAFLEAGGNFIDTANIYTNGTSEKLLGEFTRENRERVVLFMADQNRSERIARVVVEVAKELGVSASQVALAWLRYRDQPMIPIIGTRKLSQLQDNLASLNLELSDEHVKRLNDVSAIEPIFPNSFFEKEFVRNVVHGGMRDSIDA